MGLPSIWSLRQMYADPRYQEALKVLIENKVPPLASKDDQCGESAQKVRPCD